MSKLILQNIADDISFDGLPAIWRIFDFKTFSKNKTLYDFQQNGIENAIKCLYRYYQEEVDFKPNENLSANEKRKEYLWKFYQAQGLEDKADYNLKGKEERKTAKLLLEYYPASDNKISFKNFINRMSFWMATGAGKTLIIVKLLEILKKLIENKEIPPNDILILSHRDDLLDQLKAHIQEFSSYQRGIVVNLRSLKEYEKVKRESQSLFKEKEITVFYYRSDLISDEQKEKLVDFRNYDNDGQWYILLDEAHKGDKEESKRQILYSILSRNGFLFNFSATFVDPRDYATCVFNFNLERFINEGYGKHLFLLQEEAEAFRSKRDFSGIEKQKIVLKNLILLTYLQKFFRKLRRIEKGIYHKPLLLTLVNTVNIKEIGKEPDLGLFFDEIEKIGKGRIRKKIFKVTKEELLKGLKENKKFELEENEFEINEEIFKRIEYQDLLEEVYNSKTPGNIEVLVIPGNRQELIFKLRTSEKPFASIKIGDITNWLREKLEGYEINESFYNESVFRRINRDDSDINILMGSRAFYEGWDSNRPNVILFINIGIGKDAKKFVQQSIGRGVRIEPIKNKRKRLLGLFNSKEIFEKLFKKIKNFVLPIETLSIAGTKRDNLKEIIATFKEIEEKSGKIIPNIDINKEAQEYPLFIPVYKESLHRLAEERNPQKFTLSKDDFELAKVYFNYLEDPRVFLMYHDADLKTYSILRNSFTQFENFYRFEKNSSVLNPVLTTEQILNHLSLIPQEFDRFKKLEEEIIHFKKIKFLGKEKLDEFLNGIEKVKSYKEREEKLKQLQLFFEKDKDVKKFMKSLLILDKEYPEEVSFNSLKIKYLPHHYYFPLILSEKEKIDYLNHIISEPSEVRLINRLEEYLEKEDNLFQKFDWWFFSKIDEHTDNVYLPYYDPQTHALRQFKPDFVFWLCKNKEYFILFVDPKSRTYTDYEYKVEWYKRLFEEKDNKPKTFLCHGYKIKINLSLICDDKNKVAQVGLENYWFDNFEKLLKRVISKKIVDLV